MNKKLLLLIIVIAAAYYFFVYKKNNNASQAANPYVSPQTDKSTVLVDASPHSQNVQTQQALSQGYSGSIDRSGAQYAAHYKGWTFGSGDSQITDTSGKVYKVL